MQSFLHQCWYEKHPLRWGLLPFSILFFCLSQLRRYLYRLGIKRAYHPGVPVLVVGNISVGGNGKTPVVLAVVQWLLDMGLQPGILSRGYGGACKHFPHKVITDDSANWVGDEPKLMANRNHCPVVIDPLRARGAKALVAQGCNIIVCDDGLQHYALQRDIEWVVMDDRRLGNGWLLPMGPLRELPARLHSVNAIIHNGKDKMFEQAASMQLTYRRFVNVADPSIFCSVDEFVAKYAKSQVHALAGIGSPERFFASLKALGFSDVNEHALADHHQFTQADIPEQLTLMTEKDAVKCQSLAHNECWYLQVDATIDNAVKLELEKQITRLRDK